MSQGAEENFALTGAHLELRCRHRPVHRCPLRADAGVLRVSYAYSRFSGTKTLKYVTGGMVGVSGVCH